MCGMSTRDETLGNGNHVSTVSSTSTCEPVSKLALFEAKCPNQCCGKGCVARHSISVCDVVEAYHTCTRTYENSSECF